MESAGWRRGILGESERDVREAAREIARRGRRTVLIRDDAEPLALAREAQHRHEEVRAVLAHHPGCADDGMAPIGGAHPLLAGFLARPINAEGSHRVILDVRLGFSSGEDVIGRDVHERDVCLRGLGREHGGRERVERPSRGDLAFGLVHRRESCRVDYRRPRTRGDGARDLLWSRKIELGPSREMDARTFGPGMTLELEPHLSRPAGHQDVHGCHAMYGLF